MSEPLLRIRNLTTDLDTPQGPVRALKGVSFDLGAGEALAVVGESGCGKTMLARCIMGLRGSCPGRVAAEDRRFQGRQLLGLRERERTRLRGRSMSMVFQEPMSSLNPVLSIGRQVSEVFEIHAGFRGRRAREAALEALRQVGLPNPRNRMRSYPHELSGGMRQRVCLAMALALEPALVLADEPTTALDVTIQAQILSLLRRKLNDRGGALLLATQALAPVGEICRRVLVMYAETIVEDLTVEQLWRGPLHPYTQGLIDCMPQKRSSAERPELRPIPGSAPSLRETPSGCPFHTRCLRSMDICRREYPRVHWSAHDHRVHCWLYIEDKEDAQCSASA